MGPSQSQIQGFPKEEAEFFRDLKKPMRFSGGGVVADCLSDLKKHMRFSGGGSSRSVFSGLTEPTRFGGGGGVVAQKFSFP